MMMMMMMMILVSSIGGQSADRVRVRVGQVKHQY